MLRMRLRIAYIEAEFRSTKVCQKKQKHPPIHLEFAGFLISISLLYFYFIFEKNTKLRCGRVGAVPTVHQLLKEP